MPEPWQVARPIDPVGSPGNSNHLLHRSEASTATPEDLKDPCSPVQIGPVFVPCYGCRSGVQAATVRFYLTLGPPRRYDRALQRAQQHPWHSQRSCWAPSNGGRTEPHSGAPSWWQLAPSLVLNYSRAIARFQDTRASKKGGASSNFTRV